MAHYNTRFWLLWVIGAVMAVMVCSCYSWDEDTLLLAVVFALSLIAVAFCHKASKRVAGYNILFWLGYNVLLSYGLLFKSKYGSGLTWWFYMLCLNCLQFIILTIYSVFSIYKKKKQ